MEITCQFINENGIKIEEWMSCYDESHDGTIDMGGLQSIFKKNEIPMSKLDVHSIFAQIFKSYNSGSLTKDSRIYGKDFIILLKEMSKESFEDRYTPYGIKPQ
jgi:Ca2+-binding EF-hand superfamily protein